MYATKGRLFLVLIFFSVFLLPSKSFAACNAGDFEMMSGIGYGNGSDTAVVGAGAYSATLLSVYGNAAAAADADASARINDICEDAGYFNSSYRSNAGVFSHLKNPAPGGKITWHVIMEKEYTCCSGTLPAPPPEPPAPPPAPPPVITPPPTATATPVITPVMPPPMP